MLASAIQHRHAVLRHAVLQAHGTFDMKEPYYRQLNVWAQALPQASPATQQQASTIPGLSVICGDGTMSPQMQPLQQQVLQAGAVSMLPTQLVVGGDAAGAQEVGMAGAGAVAGVPVADAAAAAAGAAAGGTGAAGSGGAQSATSGVCALMV
jgi:hypothetical protein